MGKCVHWNEIAQPLEGHVYLPQHRRVRSQSVKSALKLSPEPSSRPRRPSYEIYAPSDAARSHSRQTEPFATLKPSPPPFHPQQSPPVAKASQSIYALPPKPTPSHPPHISIHSSLRLGASKPPSHHEQELACHPPLKCIYLLVEICHGRFNIEVHGSPVTVGDIISRITSVLRGKLGMGLCGAHDRTISQFAGVSLRSQDGDQSKWKVHLKNHSWAS